MSEIQVQFLRNFILKNFLLCMLYVLVNTRVNDDNYYTNDSCAASYEEFEIDLQNCDCRRRISKQIPNMLHHQWFNKTTCSKDAFYRGPGQKIVGISLYGDLTMRKL